MAEAGIGEIRNVATYKSPMSAILNDNRLVKVIATADMVGKSPVFQFVDLNGRIGWDSQNNFQIIDEYYLPPSNDLLRDNLWQKTHHNRLHYGDPDPNRTSDR